MRVLHLLTALGPGGAEIWLLNMLRVMDRSECAMDFCLKWPEAGNMQQVAIDLGAEVHVVRLKPSHVGYVRGLRALLANGRYDVVHSHEFVYSGIGVWVAKQMGVPVVCTFHHWQSPPEAPFLRKPVLREMRAAYGAVSLRYALRNATFVTTLSKKVMRTLKPDFARSPNCRILSLSAKAPPEQPAEATRALRRALDIAEDAPVILHVGRFIEQKNHDGVLDVFERVLRTIPNAILVLVGQGPLREAVLARIEKSGLSKHVRFLGVRNDVPALMSVASVFLFPSRDEGFGLAALEANAAGLPVVGSAIPGLDEAVVHGETALLHDLSDVDGMARSVADLIRDPARAGALGRAGRERAINEYSHEASARKLRDLYAECIAPKRAR